MKTGAYWFKFLTEKEQEEFKVNCGGWFDFKMVNNYMNFKSFITSSFNWVKTPQGTKYWHEISQRKTD